VCCLPSARVYRGDGEGTVENDKGAARGGHLVPFSASNCRSVSLFTRRSTVKKV